MKSNELFLIEDMNGHQIKEKVNDETIALLILGACENHGDHLPFGSDFIFPLELAKRVAIKIKNLVIFPLEHHLLIQQQGHYVDLNLSLFRHKLSHLKM